MFCCRVIFLIIIRRQNYQAKHLKKLNIGFLDTMQYITLGSHCHPVTNGTWMNCSNNIIKTYYAPNITHLHNLFTSVALVLIEYSWIEQSHTLKRKLSWCSHIHISIVCSWISFKAVFIAHKFESINLIIMVPILNYVNILFGMLILSSSPYLTQTTLSMSHTKDSRDYQCMDPSGFYVTDYHHLNAGICVRCDMVIIEVYCLSRISY